MFLCSPWNNAGHLLPLETLLWCEPLLNTLPHDSLNVDLLLLFWWYAIALRFISCHLCSCHLLWDIVLFFKIRTTFFFYVNYHPFMRFCSYMSKIWQCTWSLDFGQQGWHPRIFLDNAFVFELTCIPDVLVDLWILFFYALSLMANLYLQIFVFTAMSCIFFSLRY